MVSWNSQGLGLCGRSNSCTDRDEWVVDRACDKATAGGGGVGDDADAAPLGDIQRNRRVAAALDVTACLYSGCTFDHLGPIDVPVAAVVAVVVVLVAAVAAEDAVVAAHAGDRNLVGSSRAHVVQTDKMHSADASAVRC